MILGRGALTEKERPTDFEFDFGLDFDVVRAADGLVPPPLCPPRFLSSLALRAAAPFLACFELKKRIWSLSRLPVRLNSSATGSTSAGTPAGTGAVLGLKRLLNLLISMTSLHTISAVARAARTLHCSTDSSVSTSTKVPIHKSSHLVAASMAGAMSSDKYLRMVGYSPAVPPISVISCPPHEI